MSFFKRYKNRTNINEIFFNMLYDELHKFYNLSHNDRKDYFKNYYKKNKNKYKR